MSPAVTILKVNLCFVIGTNGPVVRKDKGGRQRQLDVTLRRSIMFFGDRMIVFGVERKCEPIRDIARDAPKGLEAPHAIIEGWVRSSVGMQLDATARTPSVAEPKSCACANLNVTYAAYIGVARCFIAAMIYERDLQPHS